ncbi:MAG: thiamine phosphate synthase [Bifidobacterium tibiigranuli]|jgi:thiamine-phosphate diphosphorylase|uniref:thiamine phosphate synthase n=1 Tax=Bifidobacterium tibiigranuli TaxID=2172043 RepID=UPI0023548772|nr:thiamine phosphate synthase [Bifidobacterium tibiigranuli]MCH3973598.1 thiamine phosphate synthase [Bifidobacterium tibiigranuli]MCH4189744.1 thiamine phosphate synthase [Bifidobacterium tibiigranuli]MCH4204657.1 thiamine phosphate synthase [Bifidobacterium tibiigranuli]MCH4275433.1 thiamine phosphate synthase [Bifidobacterium tibiigranuli]MCI1211402.1 thiamine phosphate synthase [Bifidobacterium tibiigranuli]
MTTAKPDLADSVDWRLYFVTDTPLAGGPERVPWFVEQAVIGGAGVVQIRDKTLPHDDFLALTKACVEANQRAYEHCGKQAALVVNDRLEVAEELGLNVHMGQSDGDIREARRRLGDGLLIGLSISNQRELDAELADQSADVLGLSPIWDTPTKTDTEAALGLDGAAKLVQQTAGRAKTVAIGGINHSNVRSVIGTGVDGICVVSAIAARPDPQQAAVELLSAWGDSSASV